MGTTKQNKTEATWLKIWRKTLAGAQVHSWLSTRKCTSQRQIGQISFPALRGWESKDSGNWIPTPYPTLTPLACFNIIINLSNPLEAQRSINNNNYMSKDIRTSPSTIQIWQRWSILATKYPRTRCTLQKWMKITRRRRLARRLKVLNTQNIAASSVLKMPRYLCGVRSIP